MEDEPHVANPWLGGFLEASGAHHAIDGHGNAAGLAQPFQSLGLVAVAAAEKVHRGKAGDGLHPAIGHGGAIALAP